jgi:glycosyltransferase involved in cell wall biosynthesis
MIFVSTTDWDAPQFGSRQQIAQRLAQRGHRLLFVDVPRALHSLVSDPAGTRRALGRLGRLREVAARLVVYTPWPVLPVYYHPLTNAVNQRLLARDLQHALARLGWRPDVLWTYWPNSAALVGRLGERLAVYHCIDDFSAVSYPLIPRGSIAHLEADLCRRAGLIFTRTEALAEARRGINPETYVLPGGVDTVHFDPARVTPAADIAALPRPRVGLVGTLDDRLDVQLLAACADQLPEASFVLVGPVKGHRVDLAPLAARPNVHLLPARPHDEVPSVVAAFDVGLIPYRRNAYTEALSPIKLYEYLAMGKPVVASDLPYVRREAAHVAIATGAEATVAAIRARVDRPPAPEERAVWRAVAEANTWERQVDVIEEHIARRLNQPAGDAAR